MTEKTTGAPEAPAIPEPVAASAPEAPAASAALPTEDEFAAAFAEMHREASAAAATAPAPAVPAGEPSPAPASSGGGSSNAPTPTAAPGAAASDGTPAPTPTPAAAPPEFVSRADFEALQQQLADLRDKAPTTVPSPAPSPAPEALPPVYTAPEQAVLDKYLAEWPDVAAGELLRRRAEYQNLAAYVFDQVRQYIAPLQQTVEERLPPLEETTQYRELRQLVPDYDDVRDPVIEWVGKQPAYLKTAYTAVTSNGTPEEVADLIERFRKETGWTAPAAAATPTPAAAATPALATAAPGTPVATPAAAPAPAARGISPAAAAVAASLKPVKGNRTEPAASADPNDYEGAWKEFANT